MLWKRDSHASTGSTGCCAGYVSRVPTPCAAAAVAAPPLVAAAAIENAEEATLCCCCWGEGGGKPTHFVGVSEDAPSPTGIRRAEAEAMAAAYPPLPSSTAELCIWPSPCIVPMVWGEEESGVFTPPPGVRCPTRSKDPRGESSGSWEESSTNLEAGVPYGRRGTPVSHGLGLSLC